MDYLIIDGKFHGTGVKDGRTRFFLELDELCLPRFLTEKIVKWQNEYEYEFVRAFSDQLKVAYLDNLGIELAKEVSIHLGIKVDYFSDAYMKFLHFGEHPQLSDEDDFD